MASDIAGDIGNGIEDVASAGEEAVSKVIEAVPDLVLGTGYVAAGVGLAIAGAYTLEVSVQCLLPACLAGEELACLLLSDMLLIGTSLDTADATVFICGIDTYRDKRC